MVYLVWKLKTFSLYSSGCLLDICLTIHVHVYISIVKNSVLLLQIDISYFVVKKNMWLMQAIQQCCGRVNLILHCPPPHTHTHTCIGGLAI